MPKKLRDDLTSSIEAELARHPGGVGMEGLHAALSDALSRRTLLRRLDQLVRQGRADAEGRGRGRRYRSASVATALAVAEPSRDEGQVDADAHIPVSPEGEQIRRYVRQALQGRKPVGYRREFLEGYQPNETRYLSPSLCDYLGNIGRPPEHARPAGTHARDILARLLIDLSWASSRLEGNTYSRLDTQNLIERGRAAEGKDRREAQMILNHKAAIEFLVEQAEDIGFDSATFCNLHALLSENLLADPNEGGRLRRRIVEVSGTVFHPLGVPQQVEAYFNRVLEKASAISDPFEQAFFIMVHVPYLQPFIDVNKRVSRLAANIPLIQRNLCPLSFVDVPDRAYVDGTLGVYELANVALLRDVFVWAYERSCQRYMAIRDTVADPDPLRLLHREALVAVVAGIVRGHKAPDEAAVRALAAKLVPPEDLPHIVALALADLHGLHEGNVSRFRLRLSEYRDWHNQVGSTP